MSETVQLTPLLKLGLVACPQGCGLVTIHGDAGERIDQKAPPRCPECKADLGLIVTAMLTPDVPARAVRR